MHGQRRPIGLFRDCSLRKKGKRYAPREGSNALARQNCEVHFAPHQVSLRAAEKVQQDEVQLAIDFVVKVQQVPAREARQLLSGVS